MAWCPHHRLMCHPHFHHHLHTTTYPICDCRYQLAVSETPSHFCKWTIVSNSQKRAQDVSWAHGSFFFLIFFYNTNIYLWLDHTTSPRHVWPRDRCIDTSNQHQNDDDGHMATWWYKGLGMCLKPLLRVATSPLASTQPTARMCHPWERREHSPRDGQHVVCLLGL